MKISLRPQRRDDALVIVKSGDALTLNGVTFDFAPLPDGATLPAEAIASDWFAGPVSRIDGALQLTLVLPHGANPPPHVAYPAPIIDPADGVIALPRGAE